MPGLIRKPSKFIQKLILLSFLILLFALYLISEFQMSLHNIHKITTPLRAASLGVIETCSSDVKGRILALDHDLTVVAEKFLPYASVGTLYTDPVVKNEVLHVVARGHAFAEHLFSLGVNLRTLDLTTYTSELSAANSITANEQYVFTCNTGSAPKNPPEGTDPRVSSTYISRANMQTGDIIKTVIPNQYADLLVWTHDSLFVFLTPLEETDTTSLLYRYDENLNLTATIDISSLGFQHGNACVDGDFLYFTSSTKNNPQALETIDAYEVGILDITNHKLFSIPLKHPHARSMQIIDKKLYVAHYDTLQNKGNTISVHDLMTNTTSEYTLEPLVMQILCVDKSLYVLSERSIYQYDYATMRLSNKTDLAPMKGGGYTYLSLIFPLKINPHHLS